MFLHPLRSVSLRTLTGAACLAMSGAAGLLAAGDPSAPRPPAQSAVANPIAMSDVALARSALAAIDADPDLKKVNLIVSIVDRGAVIGGPVATEQIRRRAEEVVRGVPGIKSVKNTCFVQAEPDPLLRAVANRMRPDTKPTDAATLPGVALPQAAPAGYLPPLPPSAPSDLLVAAAPQSAVVAQHATVPLVSVLGAPVAAAGAGAVVRVQPLPPVAAPPAAPALPTAPASLTGSTVPVKPTDVQTAVAAIRKTDTRFAGMLVEVKPDGGLFVTGRSARAADAWDFTAELRKVPGVVRVAVDPNLVR
ncbi:BON domain-containing protein [Frigoriglobus tundricola]|uniref:BON domain-containing protein n=1 Tax=Frigoriglobus tundricola TaxID=2774151 RepID=A0A6M5YH85_9BACT|nr:BON domain-containing protein [Frigoriglobus tundricola]QJW93419.1 hypothetical protein FTUN_0925 [Frigoriglobus tundricola]